MIAKYPKRDKVERLKKELIGYNSLKKRMTEKMNGLFVTINEIVKTEAANLRRHGREYNGQESCQLLTKEIGVAIDKFANKEFLSFWEELVARTKELARVNQDARDDMSSMTKKEKADEALDNSVIGLAEGSSIYGPQLLKPWIEKKDIKILVPISPQFVRDNFVHLGLIYRAFELTYQFDNQVIAVKQETKNVIDLWKKSLETELKQLGRQFELENLNIQVEAQSNQMKMLSQEWSKEVETAQTIFRGWFSEKWNKKLFIKWKEEIKSTRENVTKAIDRIIDAASSDGTRIQGQNKETLKAVRNAILDDLKMDDILYKWLINFDANMAIIESSIEDLVKEIGMENELDKVASDYESGVAQIVSQASKQFSSILNSCYHKQKWFESLSESTIPSPSYLSLSLTLSVKYLQLMFDLKVGFRNYHSDYVLSQMELRHKEARERLFELGKDIERHNSQVGGRRIGKESAIKDEKSDNQDTSEDSKDGKESEQRAEEWPTVGLSNETRENLRKTLDGLMNGRMNVKDVDLKQLIVDCQKDFENSRNSKYYLDSNLKILVKGGKGDRIYDGKFICESKLNKFWDWVVMDEVKVSNYKDGDLQILLRRILAGEILRDADHCETLLSFNIEFGGAWNADISVKFIFKSFKARQSLIEHLNMAKKEVKKRLKPYIEAQDREKGKEENKEENKEKDGNIQKIDDKMDLIKAKRFLQQLKIVRNMIASVAEIHNDKILHRNIELKSFSIDASKGLESNRIVIGDFGIATLTSQTSEHSTVHNNDANALSGMIFADMTDVLLKKYGQSRFGKVRKEILHKMVDILNNLEVKSLKDGWTVREEMRVLEEKVKQLVIETFQNEEDFEHVKLLVDWNDKIKGVYYAENRDDIPLYIYSLDVLSDLKIRTLSSKQVNSLKKKDISRPIGYFQRRIEAQRMIQQGVTMAVSKHPFLIHPSMKQLKEQFENATDLSIPLKERTSKANMIEHIDRAINAAHAIIQALQSKQD